MPLAVPPAILPYPERPQPQLPPAAAVSLDGILPPPRMEDGARVSEQPDGGAIIDFNPFANLSEKSKKFDANLALEMDDTELNSIAAELLIGIQNDDDSRKESLDQIAEGIKLLGFIVEESRTDVGTTAPLEGMSTVRHPLLSSACLLFQANARGALLPAAGPAKIRDDRPQKSSAALPPPTAMMPPSAPPGVNPHPPGGAPPIAGPPAAPMNGAPSLAPPGPVPGAPFPPPPQMPMPGLPSGLPPPMPEDDRDELADALEEDFNHFLTTTAREYYPDTDQMMFRVGFGGKGIKKVYNCPIRRRPVSESINIEDFIVSNALTDLGNAGRKTHRLKMRPSTLKRMQILGSYRDCPITQPTQADSPTAVDQAKAAVAGVTVQVADPKDADHTILECYCEWDLDQYAPKQFKGKGLPLPYRVTIEKESQQVLEVRRNWAENDPQCLAKEYFVEFTFVPGFGFYGIGLLHILGNTAKCLTAAWRILTDNGMFSNFPGFIFNKGAGRQITNQFRVPPGGGVGLDVGLQSIKDAIMPLPYKDLGPAFTTFIAHVEELGQQLGGTSNINIGEGRQDAPVGTTLALIEQATKPTGAVMKRLHSAQSAELMLLKERFKEDPEAFWRFNKKPAMPWQKDQFLKALEDFDLVPVSDPNNPTSMHRAAKAEWLKQVAIAAPGLLDPKKVFLKAASLNDIDDAEDLLAEPTAQQAPPVDPAKMAEVQVKAQKLAADQQEGQQKMAFQAQQSQVELADKAAERESKERVATIQRDTEQLRLAATLAIHSDKTEAAERALRMKVGADVAAAEQDRQHALATQQFDLAHEHVGRVGEQSHALRQQAHDQAHSLRQQQLDHEHERQLAEAAARQQRQSGSQT